jgi:hypothetical protein
MKLKQRFWRTSWPYLLVPRTGPFGTGLRLDEFAAEAGLELLGVGAVGKAEDDVVDVVAAE